MPSWVMLGIPAVAVVVVAVGVIVKKGVLPAANIISTAEKGAPLFREMVEQFGDMPEALKVLKDIAAQFHTDSGTTLRDVVNRLEQAAEANRIAIEALVIQETVTAQHVASGQEASRMLAQEDRVQIATLLSELRRANAKIDDAAAAGRVVADDLEASHLRAEEHGATSAPGEASDSAMRRPDAGVSTLAVLFMVVVLSAVLGLASGVAALVYANKVERLTQDVAEVGEENARLREDSDVSACISANVSRAAIRAAFNDSLLALVPVGTELTAEQQGRIDAYNARVAAGLPFRDCSPAGIAKFLENPPVDPAAYD